MGQRKTPNQQQANKNGQNYLLRVIVPTNVRPELTGQLNEKPVIFILNSGADESFIGLDWALNLEATQLKEAPLREITLADGTKIRSDKEINLTIKFDCARHDSFQETF